MDKVISTFNKIFKSKEVKDYTITELVDNLDDFFYAQHMAIVRKAEYIVDCMGKLNYCKVKHKYRELDNLSLMEIKLIFNETLNIIFANEFDTKVLNNDSNRNIKERIETLKINKVYDVYNTWIRLLDENNQVIQLNELNKVCLVEYFNLHFILYCIRYDLDLPKIDFKHLGEVEFISKLIEDTFNNEEKAYMKSMCSFMSESVLERVLSMKRGDRV